VKLTDEQQAVLDGEQSPVRAEYLRQLIEWGEAFGAERLVPVENVMPNGMSVPNRTLGDLPYDLIQSYIDFVKSCLCENVRVTTTIQATCLDLERPEFFGSDMRQVPAQREFLDIARESGFALTWTCAPYLIGNVPVKGQICAWTESHAVVYINSFLGARTTRNGTESAIAAAVTGWVPEFGVLRTENRKARFVVNVEADLKTDTDWGCLGFFAGRAGGLRIPAFVGPRSPRLEAARQLCAALATSGGAPMLHIVGVTPEAPTLEAACQDSKPEETVTFGSNELAGIYETLRSNTGSEIDFVYFGCPHATLQEVVEIATALRGKKVHENVRLLVSMSYAMMMQARRLGYVQEIEKARGSIMVDTCPTNAYWPHTRRMATPAVKTCFYAQNLLGCEGLLAPLTDCIRVAETGRWNG